MTVESLPAFTRLARQRWESIPDDIRQCLLANVWCGQCRHGVPKLKPKPNAPKPPPFANPHGLPSRRPWFTPTEPSAA